MPSVTSISRIFRALPESDVPSSDVVCHGRIRDSLLVSTRWEALVAESGYSENREYLKALASPIEAPSADSRIHNSQRIDPADPRRPPLQKLAGLIRQRVRW